MTKPFVFTLMPFDPNFDDIYKLGIKATCEELNAYCERVDEQIFQGSILDRILNQISKADVIVADMSGRNPKVFFEVGYAKALDKKLILLTSSSKDIPFDLKHYSHIVYDSSIVTLKEQLRKHLQYYFANLEKSQSEMFVGLNLFVYGVKLSEGEVTTIEVPTNGAIPLTVENVSGKVFEINTLHITATSGDSWLFGDHKNKKYILDRNNKEKWLLYNDTPIFHGEEHTYELCYASGAKEETKVVHLSIFTRSGQGNYILEIVPKPANKSVQ